MVTRELPWKDCLVSSSGAGGKSPSLCCALAVSTVLARELRWLLRCRGESDKGKCKIVLCLKSNSPEDWPRILKTSALGCGIVVKSSLKLNFRWSFGRLANFPQSLWASTGSLG